jgi:hypothetical protein
MNKDKIIYNDSKWAHVVCKGMRADYYHDKHKKDIQSFKSEEELKVVRELVYNDNKLQDLSIFPDKKNAWVSVEWEYRPITVNIQDAFKSLAFQWKKETIAYSTMIKRVSNPNYKLIIGLGTPAIPLMLEDLHKEMEYWFVALSTITKQNPVPKEEMGNIEKMRERWLEWGKKKYPGLNL